MKSQFSSATLPVLTSSATRKAEPCGLPVRSRIVTKAQAPFSAMAQGVLHHMEGDGEWKDHDSNFIMIIMVMMNNYESYGE